ncbi:hypothetical protein GCM10010448_29900 [Streptomyces glomeratus]|uniref:Lipoprotein n=1 Tax=Streptomyces glomeratus TaxID=284452 RepID=A0ABP6LMK8_9ACTN
MVQLAACAGAVPSASVSGATSPVMPSATAPRLRISLMTGLPYRVSCGLCQLDRRTVVSVVRMATL